MPNCTYMVTAGVSFRVCCMPGPLVPVSCSPVQLEAVKDVGAFPFLRGVHTRLSSRTLPSGSSCLHCFVNLIACVFVCALHRVAMLIELPSLLSQIDLVRGKGAYVDVGINHRLMLPRLHSQCNLWSPMLLDTIRYN